jgi:hypothetical protein
MARRAKVVPRTLTSAERRVLAAFISGRLSAGRLDAELEQARASISGGVAAAPGAALRAA